MLFYFSAYLMTSIFISCTNYGTQKPVAIGLLLLLLKRSPVCHYLFVICLVNLDIIFRQKTKVHQTWLLKTKNYKNCRTFSCRTNWNTSCCVEIKVNLIGFRAESGILSLCSADLAAK